MNELEPLIHYLAEVRRTATADARKLAAEARNVKALHAIAEEAARLLDNMVLRFGVIGDSNAGKSRLIGGLIGKADALPVNPIPETGNIAILRARSDDTLTATTLGPYRLRFLSREDARECTAYLLDAACDELKGISGTTELIRRGRELKQQVREELAFDLVAAWVAEAWQAVAGLGVNARLRLTELLRFVQAWRCLGKALCGEKEIEAIVTREVAEAAMVLPKSAVPDTYAQFAAELNRLLERAIGHPGSLDALPPVLTVDLAAACYPLVRDIRIDVRVPGRIWNLRNLRVDAIELCDFPGIAAQGTAARDRYLAMKERQENRVHTWAIVINSTDLTGSRAVDVVKELPGDRIVAVANRFDDLPLRKDGYLDELKRLIAPEAPPRTQPEVLAHLKPLGPLVELFKALTRPERSVFVSAMLGLFELDQAQTQANVLTPAMRRDWATEIQPGQQVQPLWGRLAEKLRSVDAEAPLAGWLEAYARPDGQGGLQQLRRILFEHANAVGLQQLADEIKSRLPALNDDIGAFLASVDHEGNQSRLSADNLRTRLDQLGDVFREHGLAPASLDDVRGNTNNRARAESLAGPGPRSLRELVRDEVLMRVWDWPVWNVLFDAVGPDGFVDCSPGSGSTPGEEEDLAPWDTVKLAPPLRAGELHPFFRASYVEVEEITVATLRSALLDFLTSISKRLTPLATDLSPLAQTSPRNVVNFAIQLLDERNLKRFFKDVACVATDKRPEDLFWRYRYPYLLYPDDAGGLSPGPFFGWAPARKTQRRNITEHQMYVIRLRTELAAAIEAAITRHLSDGLQGFRNRFKEMVVALQDAVKNLKAQSDTNLLALFGKASAQMTLPPRDLEIRYVEYPIRNPA